MQKKMEIKAESPKQRRIAELQRMKTMMAKPWMRRGKDSSTLRRVDWRDLTKPSQASSGS